MEVSEDNSCTVLSENTWNKENSYIGFDFENIWKLTDGGARLIRQTYIEPEEMPEITPDEKADNNIGNPEVKSDAGLGSKDQNNQPEALNENLGTEGITNSQLSVLPEDSEVQDEPADTQENADNGIALLAEDLTSGDFTYTVSGSNATITGYTGSLTTISIPEKIGGYTVTAIGNSAFNGNETIRIVNLPNTITSVGNYAFENCTALETVTMSYNSTVEYTASIGGNAFLGCTSLTSIGLSENVTTIGDYAFSGCTALSGLILPESLKTMGHHMIESTAISSITIPKNVTSSGYDYYSNGALANCKSLTEVIFEDGMKKIPDYICASGGYTSYITKVVIPESVTDIGSNAFYKCDNMTIYGYKNSYAESYAITESIPFVSVSIAKNASADDVLKKMNLDTLVNNVSFAETNINGPTVTIAGKTFPLFSVPASMDIELGDKVQAKVDDEKKTIQVLIGFDDFSGSAKLDPSENSTAYWSESYKQVKSLYTGITGKNVDTTKLWNQYSKLRGRLKKMGCSIGIEASASVAGYMEFNYASGEITYSSGGVILEANLEDDWNYKLPPCPAVYVTFGVEAGFNGKLSLVRENTMNYTPAMNAGIDLTATLGVGAGSKKIKTYAEVGLKGTLGVNVSLPADSLSDALLVKLTAYAYFDSKVFGFDGSSWGPEEFAGVQLYPSSKARSMALFGGRDLVDFNLDTATPSDRSYLNMPMALSLDTENTLYSKENLYRYNAPQLVCLNDGSMLLLWIDDNGNKPDVNKTSLMYSVYDGAAWSTAEAIAETGGANDYPAVWSDGQKVRIVWQKAAEQPDDATLPDVLGSVELYTVTYQDGTLSEAAAVTAGNSAYEMMQSVAGNGDSMAVVWMENSENNPFQAEGTNSIKASRYENGKWTESTVDSSVAEVANLNASYVGKDLVITYESSAEDGGSITMIKGGDKKTFAGSSAEVSGGVLYYCTDDGLMSYDMAGRITENVLPAAIGDFTVLDDGVNKMIVATEYTGFASELAAYVFDRTTGTWSDKVTLTENGKYIRDYSAGLDKNGNLVAALNSAEVDEESDTIYGNAALRVMSFSDTEDLVIGKEAYFENDSLIPGGTLPLNFSVKNNGTKAVSQIHVDILDSSGSVLQSGTVPCTVGVGETAEVRYNYTLPRVLANQTVTIKAYTENETKLTDNTVSVEIGMADVAVGNMYLSGNGSAATLKGEIQNLGYKDASDVTVTVYDANEEGDVIGTAELGVIEKSGTKVFEVSIPEAYLDVNPLASGNALYVAVSTTVEEMDYSNNTDTYLIKSSTDEPLVMNFNDIVLGSDGTAELEVTYSSVVDVAREPVAWTSSDESVVTVADGKLTAVGTGEATVTATINGHTVSCVVNVNNNIAVAGIYLEESSINILAGQTKQLVANVLPANATNQKITWKSANEAIATVGNSGQVQAITVGTTEVTAYTDDGYKTASCKVTVSQDAETEYKVAFSGGTGASGQRPSTLSGTAGTLVALPENSYTKEGYHFVGWTDGKNTYEANASYRIPYRDVTLTAVWASEEKQEYIISASCQTGGSITPDGEVAVSEGGAQKFAITAEEGYRIGDVKVDGESVGTVSEYIFEDVTANHTIEALFKKDASIKIEAIQLSQTQATLEKGQTLLLNAEITPNEAEDQQLKWSTSDIAVASVENGLVTAIGEGTATITAESQDGSNVKASCKITVKETETDPGTKDPTDPGTKDPTTPGTNRPTDPGANTNTNTNANAKTPLSKAVITLSANTYSYDGKEKKPAVKLVKLGSKTLSSGTDYTVSYTNNKNIGTATVTITGKGNYTDTAKTTFKITAKKGSKFTVGANRYKITGSSTVSFTGLKSAKTTKVTIPKAVKIGGKNFKVTAIEAKALQNKKKVTSVTIGANVSAIGKNAFTNCKNLGKITMKSTKLKSVGKNAFKGIKATAKIKVLAKKLSAYKKLLKGKGQGSKVKITKG